MEHLSRGSKWRKWDLHIHTPASELANGFGDNWDDYVQGLFKKAIVENISAIGITDYFTIEGYKKIKTEYLANDAKLKQLFSDDEIEKIKKILVVPNIELRLNKLVGTNRINFHVIFSENVSITDIEENFLHELDFVYEGKPFEEEETRKLKINNLLSLGEKLIREHLPFKGKKPLFIGMMNAVVSDEQVTEVLNKKRSIFEGNYLLALPCDEDLSAVPWNGQDHQARKVLIQKTNVLMSSNPKTILWAIGLKSSSPEAYKDEFKSLKPCIWGSDAHNQNELFNKNGDRQVWIKAELTFEGLKQILYEPSERIKIQANRPDEKSDYLIIDTVKFLDNDFVPKEIPLNANLNTIIGGKSTGKSLLLRNIAKTIDKNEVNKRLKEVGLYDYEKSVNDFQILWKDKQSSHLNLSTNPLKKIIYIPQSYLNRLADKGDGSSSIDEIIKNVLVQEDDIKSAFTALEEALRNTQQEISKTIDQLFFLISDHSEKSKKIKELGDKKGISEEISKLDKEITVLKEKSGLTAENINLYNQLQSEIQEGNRSKTQIGLAITNLNTFSNEWDPFNKIDFSKLKGEVLIQVTQKYNELKNDFLNKWEKFITEEVTKQKMASDVVTEKINKSTESIKPLEEEVKDASALQDKMKKHVIENEKLSKITQEEEELNVFTAKIQNTITELAEHHNNYYAYLLTNKETILSQKTIEGDIRFDLKVLFKLPAFQEGFIDAICNLKQLGRFSEIDLSDYKCASSAEFHPHIEKIIPGILNDKLILKNNFSKKEAITKLLNNWYAYEYVVSQNGDNISQMSPGKKSFVLLKLLIELDNSRCPILLDQPEDDLDNRSIYEELVRFIRTKKKERQIIIATHNPNLVIGADSEEVIVANQHGDKTPNKNYKFEYSSGALENTFTSDPLTPVLYKQGIQEHVCEILEGGRQAFEQRKQKYNL